MKVIYVDIDSLRPDHLGCYGYPRPTSPTMDYLASQGTVFENAFVSDSPCMPSRAATFSGRFGINNGVVTHGPLAERMVGCTTDLTQMRDGAPLLQEYLGSRGVTTAAITPFGRHPSPWFYRGWQTFIDPDVSTWFQQVSAPQVTEHALGWLDGHHQEDFFLYLNYWDPHLPYNQPLDRAGRFLGLTRRASLPTDAQIASDSRSATLFAPWWFGIENGDDLDRYISSFDAEINYVDEQLARLLDRLKSLGIDDDTVIIISADHGEQFGEYGIYVDHCTAADATSRVPLIVHGPSHWSGGRRVTDFVLNLDLAPSICELFGLPVPRGWDGSSLTPYLRGEQPTRRDHIVFGHGLYTAQRAVRDHEWKYVRTYHSGEWAFAPEALYRINEDPAERTNVAAAHPEVLRRMRVLLFRFEHPRQYLDAACQIQDRAIDGSPLPVDPMTAVVERGPAAFYSGKARLPDWRDWPGLLKPSRPERG